MALAASLALLAPMVAACGGGSDGGSDGGSPAAGEEPADVRPDVPRPQVSAHLTVEVGGDAVSIDYRLVNDGDLALLVANRLPRPAGAGVSYDDALAYVTGAGEGSVEISQRVFPTPDGDGERVQAPQIGATVLEPGSSLAVTLDVPLPLERNQPFGDDLGAGPITLPDEVSDVSFCLGLLPRALADAAPDEDGVVLLAHTDASAAVQYLLCSEPTPLG